MKRVLEKPGGKPLVVSLETEIASILAEIESENMPARLVLAANRMQVASDRRTKAQTRH